MCRYNVNNGRETRGKVWRVAVRMEEEDDYSFDSEIGGGSHGLVIYYKTVVHDVQTHMNSSMVMLKRYENGAQDKIEILLKSQKKKCKK